MVRVAIPLVVNLGELQHVHLGAFRLRPLDLTTSLFQLFRLRPGQFMFFCGLFVPGAMVSSLVLLTAMVLGLSAGPEPVTAAITSSLQSILRNTHGSKEYDYPTDITRDILPVSACHPMCFLFIRRCEAYPGIPLTSCLDSRPLSQVGLDSTAFAREN